MEGEGGPKRDGMGGPRGAGGGGGEKSGLSRVPTAAVGTSPAVGPARDEVCSTGAST